MEKLPKKCPYPKSRSTGFEKEIVIREDYELEYDKDHIVQKVKVGETDIVKEVQSHKGEAGLLNAIKNAIAHGEDPSVIYAKTEPGVEFAIPNNATMDELIELSNQNKAKYAEIAKSLGVSVDDLQKAVANGTLDQLINKPAEEEKKDGEE